jgi:putative aminopeptidase FrvX
MQRLEIDTDYLVKTLLELLETPSPSGYTDGIVHLVGKELSGVGIDFEMTRRGAIALTSLASRAVPIGLSWLISIPSAPW